MKSWSPLRASWWPPRGGGAFWPGLGPRGVHLSSSRSKDQTARGWVDGTETCGAADQAEENRWPGRCFWSASVAKQARQSRPGKQVWTLPTVHCQWPAGLQALTVVVVFGFLAGVVEPSNEENALACGWEVRNGHEVCRCSGSWLAQGNQRMCRHNASHQHSGRAPCRTMRCPLRGEGPPLLGMFSHVQSARLSRLGRRGGGPGGRGSDCRHQPSMGSHTGQLGAGEHQQTTKAAHHMSL